MISTVSSKGVQGRGKKGLFLQQVSNSGPKKGFLEQEEILSRPYDGEGGDGAPVGGQLGGGGEWVEIAATFTTMITIAHLLPAGKS